MADIVIKPQHIIALGLGASGAAKLAGASFTLKNFKRWGYPDAWRPAIGAVEVATAVAALAGVHNDSARKLATAGTLSTMGGAIATHTMAGEPAYNLLPAFLLAGFGVGLLFEIDRRAEAAAATAAAAGESAAAQAEPAV